MNRHCNNCSQKESCREIFEKLGSSKAPPVLLKTVQAFLLPLILFIVVLAVADKVLAGKIASSLGKNLLALAAAAAIVFLYLLILKLWRIKH